MKKNVSPRLKTYKFGNHYKAMNYLVEIQAPTENRAWECLRDTLNWYEIKDHWFMVDDPYNRMIRFL